MLGFRKKLYNVAVVGENGMLGKEVCSWLRYESRLASSCIGQVWTLSKKDVDFSQHTNEALSYFCNNKVLNTPDVVINCAAYTDTTAIESTVEGRNKSFAENVILPRTLAEACARAKIKLIHISTDYVGSEYSTAVDFPANIYGMHKLLAEQYVENAYLNNTSTNYLILRTSWLFGPNSSHKTFIEKFMLNLYKAIAKATLEKSEKITIPVASNTSGFPTSTWFLSSFIRNAIEANLLGNTVAYQPLGMIKDGFPKIEAVSRADWAAEIVDVVCRNRGFRNVEIAKTEFPVPDSIGAVHHPTHLPKQYISTADLDKGLTLYSSYLACIKDASSWKRHTCYFIENYFGGFEELEKWIFSKLTDEERNAIEQYPRVDSSESESH